MFDNSVEDHDEDLKALRSLDCPCVGSSFTMYIAARLYQLGVEYKDGLAEVLKNPGCL
jgi:hypothetical protein